MSRRRNERDRFRELSSSSSSLLYQDDNDNEDRNGSSIRRFVLRNQFFINSLQYLSAASILFIPSTYQYYEVIIYMYTYKDK